MQNQVTTTNSQKKAFPMTQLTTDIMPAPVKKEGISEVFRKHLEAAVNTPLKTELMAFLDHEKYGRIALQFRKSPERCQHAETPYRVWEFRTFNPRDRNGGSDQQTVAAYKGLNDKPELFIIHMFQKGPRAELAEKFKQPQPVEEGRRLQYLPLTGISYMKKSTSIILG